MRDGTDEGVLLVDIRTRTWARVAISGVCIWLIGAIPIARELASRHPILEFFASTAYGGLAAMLAYVLIHRAGREVVRVQDDDLEVERLWLFHRQTENLGLRRGGKVLVEDRRLAALRDRLMVASPHLAVTFGRWVSTEDAEEIAEVLRDRIAPPSQGWGRLDGIVRRVPRYTMGAWPPGTEGVLNPDGMPAFAVHGVPIRFSRRRWWIWLPVLLVAGGFLRLPWLAFAGGALAVFSPVVFSPGGLWDRIAARWALRRVRREGRAPWELLSGWRERVLRIPAWHRALTTLLGTLVLVAVAASAVAAGFEPLALVAGLVGVFVLLRLRRALFLGTTEVQLPSNPIRIPGPVQLDFAVDEKGATFRSISFTLRRLVQLTPATKRPVVGYTHEATYLLPDDQPPPGPGERVTARFVVPDDAPPGGTRIDPRRPVCWELLVEGATDCGPYAETFPIPVFATDAIRGNRDDPQTPVPDRADRRDPS